MELTTQVPHKASQKALSAAKTAAVKTVSRAILAYQTNPANRSWQAIEKLTGLTIPDIYKADEINRRAIETWGQYYIDSTVKRVTTAFSQPQQTPAQAKVVVSKTSEIKDSDTYDLGWARLKKDQHAGYLAIMRELFQTTPHKSAILQDGNTGIGKMVIGCAVIHHIITKKLYENGNFYLHPIMIFCPKNVQEQWFRHLEKSGLGKYIGNDINVIPYSQLSATYGDAFWSEEYDMYDENKPPTIKWNPAMLPFFALFDECHKLANEQTAQTKAIMALTNYPKEAYRPRTLWMSATPGVTINNMRAFTCATRIYIPSLGINVTPQNFPTFAGLLTNEPAKPNNEAAKRWRQIMGPYIVSLPRAKWDHKAINSVILMPFASDKDREVYQSAFERYLKKIETLGKQACKNIDFLQRVALGQFRKAAEPLRMDQIGDRCDNHIKSGNVAPVCGCVFRDSVIRLVFRMLELGYKREDISIIWGGKKEIKESLVLSPDEFKQLIADIAGGYEPTKADIKRLEETLAFKETKLSYQEDTDEETKNRLRKLQEFGLTGSQNANQRQIEIDRFQTGESKMCIFTLAAGGIGLSLDHSSDLTLPRVGYFTPTYSGPEFKQALGRCERRMTLSDTYQYIVGLQGTIEESHVMPLIDKKLRCIASLTNADNEIINFHKARIIDASIRSIEQAEKDADSEDARVENIQTELEDLEENGEEV